MADRPDTRLYPMSSIPLADKPAGELNEASKRKNPLELLLDQLTDSGTLPVRLHEMARSQLDREIVAVLAPLIAAWKVTENREAIRSRLAGIVVLDEGSATSHPQYTADTAAITKIRRILEVGGVIGLSDKIRSGVKKNIPPQNSGLQTSDVSQLLDTSNGNLNFDVTALMNEIANLITEGSGDTNARDRKIKDAIQVYYSMILTEWTKSAKKTTLHISVQGSQLPLTIVQNICLRLTQMLRALKETSSARISCLENMPSYTVGVTPRKVVLQRSVVPTLRF